MSELEHKQDDQTPEATEVIPQVKTTMTTTDEQMEESQKLSTIRNILLGGQIKQYDNRFSDLENRFKEIKESLFDQTKGTLTNLEKQLKSEFETFTTKIGEQITKEFDVYTEKLDEEKKDRYASLEKFVEKQEALEKDYAEKFETIHSKIQQIEDTLSQKITEQVQAIKEDIQSEFESLSATILEKNQQQIHNKIERSEMVDFFKNMADRFTQ
jgi:phage-related protein